MAYFLSCADIPGDALHHKHKNATKIYNFVPPAVYNSIYHQSNTAGVMAGQTRTGDAGFRCLIDQSLVKIIQLLTTSKTIEDIKIFNEGTMNSSGAGMLGTITLGSYKFQDCVFASAFVCYDESPITLDHSGHYLQAMGVCTFRYNNCFVESESHDGGFGGTGKASAVYSKLRAAVKR